MVVVVVVVMNPRFIFSVPSIPIDFRECHPGRAACCQAQLLFPPSLVISKGMLGDH